VPGVEAPLDVGVRQRELDVGLGLDQCAHVRMEHLGQAVPRTDRVDLCEPLPQGGHAGRVKRHGGGPAHVLDDGGDEAGRPVLGEPPRRLLRRGEHRCPLRRVVEHQRDEATQQTHPLLLQHGGELRSIIGEEPGRSELGHGQAEGAHLREDPLRREHLTPPWDLADPPRDRCASDTAEQRTGVEGHG